MEDLLFSVAIITYNQEKYISQTLDSILQQRHSFKYEIVIGDEEFFITLNKIKGKLKKNG